MEKIVIYHGSDHIIEKPLLGLGRKNNDYGQGFYYTQNSELAKEWACRFRLDGFVNKYELRIDNLKILHLDKVENPTLTWISVLIKNRLFDKTETENAIAKVIVEHFDIDISSYDIVIGYRADDSYFSFAQSFLNNSLSLEKLELALKLGLLGNQIVLVSEKAFDNLTFIRGEQVDQEKYHQKYLDRDLNTRKQYLNLRDEEISNGTFALDIIRKLRK